MKIIRILLTRVCLDVDGVFDGVRHLEKVDSCCLVGVVPIKNVDIAETVRDNSMNILYCRGRRGHGIGAHINTEHGQQAELALHVPGLAEGGG